MTNEDNTLYHGEYLSYENGETVEVPLSMIVTLARHFCNRDVVFDAFPNNRDPQEWLHLFRIINKIADEQERLQLKPIVNRNDRTWSKNIVLWRKP